MVKKNIVLRGTIFFKKKREV